jgi:hypothetical protein
MITFPLFFSNKYNQIKNFFLNAPKDTMGTLKRIESYSYIDSTLTTEEKIEFEKRRRYQAYMKMDYLLSVVSYFDFFSLDSFKIAKKSKELSQVLQKKIITSDFLLLPFFDCNPEIKKLLEKYEINENQVSEIISLGNKIKNETVDTKTKNWVKHFFINLDIPAISERLIVPTATKYSYEINQIFEKAAENALTRFKTPVISSEILLITMLEAKKSKVGKLLKQLLKSDTNWYMFRYSLMKRLHTQELAIRTDVPKNQQYFAYLLKTQLPEIQFDILLEKDILLPGVLIFRNYLISEVLQFDFSKYIRREILASIKSSSTRRYSLPDDDNQDKTELPLPSSPMEIS